MTKSQITALLASNNRAIELSILGLYARQTVGEQRTSSTVESNGRGFNYRDAEYGTYLAKWLQSGRHLTGSHLSRARRMAAFYWRQVSEMSEVVRLIPPPAPKTYKLYGEEELCVAITQWDRFQQFPGVTQYQ
jgi:hypothetical protein